MKESRFFYFEIERAPSEIPAHLTGQFTIIFKTKIVVSIVKILVYLFLPFSSRWCGVPSINLQTFAKLEMRTEAGIDRPLIFGNN